MRAERFIRPVLASIALLALAACLEPVDPAATPVAAVRVTFADGGPSDTVQVRSSVRAVAAALAEEGYDIGRSDFTWASSDTTVAVVSELGVVRGVRAGEATISAALPVGVRGEGRIVVVPTGVAYTVPVGAAPGALAFSPDYTRLYATIGGDSLAIVDALGYFRLGAVALGLPAGSVAATGDAVYVTHPEHDSVSVISAATSARTGRLWVGAGPTGIAAAGARVFVAARYDRKVVIVEDGRVGLGIPIDGEPHDVAVSRDGRRLFAGVQRADGWRLAIAAPAYPDTIGSVALPGRPTAIATDMDGARAWVLMAGEGRLIALAEQPDGRYAVTASVDVGRDAGGLSARLAGSPMVVVSGEPALILDGVTLDVLERVPGVGTGRVAIRPDGLFAFVAARDAGVLRVVGL